MFAPLVAAIALSPHDVAVLVYTRTVGFRHDNIEVGVAAVKGMNGVTATATEDPGAFTKANLARFDVVMFLNTTGDVLPEAGERALQEFVESGGGFVGIHSAADTEYDWPWYGRLVGAYFKSHPPGTQTARVEVEAPKHPTTKMLPVVWNRRDEWYEYRVNPRPKVTVLATLDRSSVPMGEPEADHPIVWCHEVGKGRAWYTGMGHTKESFAEPLFLASLRKAIQWAAWHE